MTRNRERTMFNTKEDNAQFIQLINEEHYEQAIEFILEHKNNLKQPNSFCKKWLLECFLLSNYPDNWVAFFKKVDLAYGSSKNLITPLAKAEIHINGCMKLFAEPFYSDLLLRDDDNEVLLVPLVSRGLRYGRELEIGENFAKFHHRNSKSLAKIKGLLTEEGLSLSERVIFFKNLMRSSVVYQNC